MIELNTPDRKVLAVEDPIEYQLDGVNQVQIKPQIGLSFAHVLRSMLRHDPDVIMVGEIRDLETAQIAIQAALTGHLVLSTVHTNNAASTLTRLLDMGVEDYLMTSTLNAIVAQRLVRRLCQDCCKPYTPLPELLAQLGLEGHDAVTFWRPEGCPKCNDTGYFGRISINEVLVMSDPIRRQILHHAEATELQRAALAHAADVPGRHWQGRGRRHHHRGGAAGHPRGRLMARFHFRAVTGTGEVVEGEIEAQSQAAVVEQLRGQGHLPLAAEPVGASAAGSTLQMAAPARVRHQAGASPRGRGHDPRAGHPARCRPDGRSVPASARNLATSEAMRRLLADLLQRVQAGGTLADALGQHEDVFSRAYVSMVRAGEAGGGLNDVLGRLARYLDEAELLSEQVRSALVYPIVLLVMSGLSIVVLLTAVVPQFTPLFESAGAELPLLTRVVITAGDAAQRYWWLLLLGLLAGASGWSPAVSACRESRSDRPLAATRAAPRQPVDQDRHGAPRADARHPACQRCAASQRARDRQGNAGERGPA